MADVQVGFDDVIGVVTLAIGAFLPKVSYGTDDRIQGETCGTNAPVLAYLHRFVYGVVRMRRDLYSAASVLLYRAVTDTAERSEHSTQ